MLLSEFVECCFHCYLPCGFLEKHSFKCLTCKRFAFSRAFARLQILEVVQYCGKISLMKTLPYVTNYLHHCVIY